MNNNVNSNGSPIPALIGIIIIIGGVLYLVFDSNNNFFSKFQNIGNNNSEQLTCMSIDIRELGFSPNMATAEMKDEIKMIFDKEKTLNTMDFFHSTKYGNQESYELQKEGSVEVNIDIFGRSDVCYAMGYQTMVNEECVDNERICKIECSTKFSEMDKNLKSIWEMNGVTNFTKEELQNYYKEQGYTCK